MNMSAMLDGPSWVPVLGWTLLHFLWQGAIVGVVFALLRRSIPKRQCNVRYVNGLVALSAMAMLPLVTFFSLAARRVGGIETLSSVDVASPAAASMAGIDAATAPMDAFLPWIVAVWFAGVVLVGLRSWRQWRALVQVAHKWASPDGRLQAVVTALASRFGFARCIRVLVSDRIDTPTLIGWIKPIILLPTAVALGFPREQIELILAHELGHLRRYDHLVNLAQVVLETVLFYHPVVHWIAREVRNEREICCDELVLRVTCGGRHEYASALAALEELRQPPVHIALAASGGVLLERVRRILFAPHPVTARVGARLWLPLLALLVVTLAAAVRIDRSEPVYVGVPLPSDGLSTDAALALAVPDLGLAIRRPRLGLVELPGVEPPRAPVQASSSPSMAAVPAHVAQADRVPVSAARSSHAMAVAPVTVPTVAAEEPVPVAIPAVPVAAPVAEPGPETQAPQAVAAAPRKMPMATHTVAPEYPQSVRANRAARVALKFSIAADGSVRNIALIEGSAADAPFVRSATRALRQWHFSPSSLKAAGDIHYRQDFVFSPQVQADDGCVRRTGSLLCQRSDSTVAPDTGLEDTAKGDRIAVAQAPAR